MAVLRTSRLDLPLNGSGAYAYVAQPDDDAQHPGVVLIQEWWGIEAHIIDLAQKLAKEGFVVAVPDLYHGKISTEPNEAQKAVMVMLQNLERAINEIVATLDGLKALPNVAPKKLGLTGFCVGGFLSYKVAEQYRGLGAVAPFYAGGYDPSSEDIQNIDAPISAFYGEHDGSIPLVQVEKIKQVYAQAGKDLQVGIYDGGHAFLNPDHGMGNEAAAAEAWPKLVSFLKENLK